VIGTLPYVLLGLVFLGAVFVLARAFLPGDAESEIERRLGVLQGVEASDQAVLADALRPAWKLLLPAARGVGLPWYRTWIETSFVTAGMTGRMSADEFIAYKLTAGILSWVLYVGILAMVVLGWSPPWYVHLVVPIAGSCFPEIWISGLVSRRKAQVRKALPYVMDLLTLSVEAGLDFIAGVHKVCEKARSGPLVDELSYLLREIQVGATRQTALRNLAQRTQMMEVRSFAALLIQADQLGASIGPVLRAQSDLLRAQRFQAAERAGALAATKLLFPLILFIMPAVFIVIFGPIVLNFVYGNMVIGASTIGPAVGP
jgi:tight adherence protein C